MISLIHSECTLRTSYKLASRHCSRLANSLKLWTAPNRHLSSSVASLNLREEGNTLEDTFVDCFRPFFDEQTPVLLKQACIEFKALNNWKDFDYMLQAVGPDHPCEVELGAYNSGERLTLTFSQYIDYLKLWISMTEKGEAIPDDQILYMAQNDLPAGLLDDIEIPAACQDDSLGAGKLYNTMLWMGPASTVSPLHFDPLDNFLMQITGSKSVWLLPRSVDSTCLYSGQSHQEQSNTSAVDVRKPDLEKYPLFAKIQDEIVTCHLEPGDMLYIPAKWWHAVQSNEMSISVNAWWR